MSHLLNQMWYLITSFCLMSLPEPFFLFLSLCFPFTRLCMRICLIGLSAELFSSLNIVFWWNITVLLSLWHTGGILQALYNAAEMYFSHFGMTLLWHCHPDLMALCHFFSDGWFWLFAVNSERQSAIVSYLLMVTGNRTNWCKGTLCQGRSRHQFVWWMLHAVITKAFLK